MSDAVVHLPADVAAEIRRQCEGAYPLEACGAIFGRGDGSVEPWSVLGIRPAPNQHGDDQRRRYQVPPEFQVQAERDALALDQDVIGYFHSHPDHPAQPSEYDRAHAWFGYVYVICAVAKGAAQALNAFTLDSDGGIFQSVLIESPKEKTPPTQEVR
jgi:proteasome lid subunit RPN8/RPN11